MTDGDLFRVNVMNDNSQPVILDHLDIEINRNEIERFLRFRKVKDTHRIKLVNEAVDLALEEAGKLIEPRGVYAVVPGKALPGSDMFADKKRMAFCICTIGEGLEEKVAELFSADRLLDAVALDTAGSVAADATAGSIDRVIAERVSRDGLKTSRRASPGYGPWDVSEQRAVFELLPAEKIGVKLSPSCMMIPRKSVSFAVHVARKPSRLRSSDSCGRCDYKDCPDRMGD